MAGYAQPSLKQIDSLRNLLTASSDDTTRIKLLLDLGHLYIVKPGELASDLDTALLLSQQAYGLSCRLNFPRGRGLSFLTASQSYREKKQLVRGRQCIREAVAYLTKFGSLTDQADAYGEQAAYYSIVGEDLNRQVHLYQQIVPLLQQAGDTRKLADALKYRGDLYQLVDNYTQSLRDLQQSRTLYLSIGFTRLQALYDLLGYVSTRLGKRKQGLEYSLLALKTARQFNDSSMLCTIYNRVGISYFSLERYLEAKNFFQKALPIAYSRHDKNSALEIGLNLTAVYMKLQQENKALGILTKLATLVPGSDITSRIVSAADFLEIYTNQKKYTLARPYCAKLLELAAHMDQNDSHHQYIYSNVIPYYLATRQYDRARQVLMTNQQFCKKLAYANLLAYNHLCWFKMDSALGNYSSAIRHYQQYKTLNDSLSKETNSKQINELDLQYKNQEKEQRIQLLTQRGKLQQTDLQQVTNTRNFSIASAIMLLGLLSLGYNRYRLKQRSSRLVEAKQHEINEKNESLQTLLNQQEHLLTEKEWMLKEIHHRVKNNLQIITSLLHSQGVYLKDEAAQSAIRESQNRVHSMALIHQKLYQSDRLAAIPMDEYIVEIVDHLINSFDREGTVTKQIAIESIDLDISLAVPMGLIINEAITNSLKYAFPDLRMGTLTVELNRLDLEHYQLLIADDGVGLPSDFDPTKIGSLGMSLIRGLSKQLGGTLNISQHNGLHIKLTFKEEKIGREDLVTP